MHRTTKFGLLAAAFALASAVPSVAGAADNGSASGSPHKHAHSKRTELYTDAKGGSRTPAAKRQPGNGIAYHNGPVMLGTVNTYIIWYGNWPAQSTTPAILTDLLSSIGGSSHYNINTTYYNGSNTKVSNAVHYAGSTTDAYSQGDHLSDAAVQAVVANAINSNVLPKDTNAVYFVLTSSDVYETSGFLTQYCGWHSNATIAGSDIKFSFVGDPGRNMAACTAQSTSPNENPAADGMASVIIHELEEAATDPDLNAWYDSQGYENADKCAWTFGTQLTALNGSKYNLTLGARKFLIQRNWVNAAGGYCATTYP